jgi:hypothetical protein
VQGRNHGDDAYASDDSADEHYNPAADAAAIAGPRSMRSAHSTVPAQRGRQRARQGGDQWAAHLQQTAVKFGMESLPDRSAQAGEGLGALNAAQGVLTLAARPRCLPCRDTEKSVRPLITM